MQFYMYDFSSFVSLDVTENGLFPPYLQLDTYWQEDKTRFSYIIQKDDKYIGFALVRLIATEEKHHYSMAEFFILRRYRREGLGTAIAKQIFNLHQGQWEVFQKESNEPAQVFWKKVINEYSSGNFTERFEDGKRIQIFNS